MRTEINFDNKKIVEFCRRWKIIELELFGSILRDDFSPNSDIDILVTYAPGVSWGLFKVSKIEEELSEILGRKVDLVSRRAVERSKNRIRRQAILDNTETIYVTG